MTQKRLNIAFSYINNCSVYCIIESYLFIQELCNEPWGTKYWLSLICSMLIFMLFLSTNFSFVHHNSHTTHHIHQIYIRYSAKLFLILLSELLLCYKKFERYGKIGMVIAMSFTLPVCNITTHQISLNTVLNSRYPPTCFVLRLLRGFLIMIHRIVNVHTHLSHQGTLTKVIWKRSKPDLIFFNYFKCTYPHTQDLHDLSIVRW